MNFVIAYVLLFATMFGKPNSAVLENNLDYIVCNFLQQIILKVISIFRLYFYFDSHFSQAAKPSPNFIEEKWSPFLICFD